MHIPIPGLVCITKIILAQTLLDFAHIILDSVYSRKTTIPGDLCFD